MAISIPLGRGAPVRPPLLAAVILLLALLAWTLLPASADPTVAPTPQPIAPPMTVPGPFAAAPSPPPPMQSAPPTAALPDLVLRGVMGGGHLGEAAIFEGAGGAQRVVRIGAAIAPGVVLTAVRLDHAVVMSNGTRIRLSLGKPGGAALAERPLSTSPNAAAAGASLAAGGSQRETMEYRLGLQPVKSGSRTAGYAVRRGARLPHLSAAGLQPGDVILRVNGSELDEERLMELSWQVANSGSIEIEYSRAGKKKKIVVTSRS